MQRVFRYLRVLIVLREERSDEWKARNEARRGQERRKRC